MKKRKILFKRKNNKEQKFRENVMINIAFVFLKIKIEWNARSREKIS